MRRAQKGDHAAFADLYRLHFEQVYYIAHKMLRNTQEATEVAQDAFEKAYRNLATLENPATFQRWINVITHNLCANALRTRAKNQRYYTEVAMNDQEITLPEKNREFLPEEYLHNKEDRAAVARFVEELPAAQKETVLMYYFEDFTAAEIAQFAGVKETTIHRRLYDARETLKRRLGEPGAPKKAAVLGAAPTPVISQILKQEAVSTTATPAFESAFTAAWSHLTQKITPLSSSSVMPPQVPAAALSRNGGAALTKSLIAVITAVAIVGTGSALYVAHVAAEEPAVIREGVEPPVAPVVDVLESLETSATEGIEASPTSIPSSTIEEVDAFSQVEPVASPIVRPVIELEQRELVYHQGNAVSLATLLTDAGVYAHDAQGNQLPVTAQYYENIDFGREGEYVLAFSASDRNGVAAITQVVNIVIRGVQ